MVYKEGDEKNQKKKKVYGVLSIDVALPLTPSI